MLYNADGFALALGAAQGPTAWPAWMHFGVAMPDRAAVLALRDRLAADGVELVEEWDEAEYASVKCRDPTATSSRRRGSHRRCPCTRCAPAQRPRGDSSSG
jgi:hypothetical protein